MVAVKNAVDAYLKALPKGIDAVLLFGGDPGLVSERAKALASSVAAGSNPPGEILRLDETDLDTDPDRLAVELGTMPMFGGRKIVRVQASRRVNAAALKPLIDDRRIEGVLIVEAGALKGEDALRKLFEAAPHAAAIACNADEARDLDGLVREVLAAHKLTITPDARRLLISRLGADRGLSRAEIEKLALYGLGKTEVDEDDVLAVVGDAADLAVDRIIAAASAGNAAVAATECDRAIASGESAQYVLIAMLRHLQRLHRVRLAIEGGASLDEAVKSLRPPLFFKQRDAFLADVQRWNSQRLMRALTRATEAQALSRAGGAASSLDEAAIVQGALLDIARLAGVKAQR